MAVVALGYLVMHADPMRACTEYEAHKARAVEANARKEELFEEAKHLGAVGDRSADQRLKAMEASMKVRLRCHLHHPVSAPLTGWQVVLPPAACSLAFVGDLGALKVYVGSCAEPRMQHIQDDMVERKH